MPEQPGSNATPQGLDPTAFLLTKAIKATETGGSQNPYTQSGKSGEYGAYQFTEPTWNTLSKQYLGQDVPLQQATEAQQNEVAYKAVEQQLKEGHTQSQVASWWNSGKYDPNETGTGYNAEGVYYDVPGYVNRVKANYEKLQGTPTTVTQQQSGVPGYAPPTPPTPLQPPAQKGVAAPTETFTGDLSQGNIGGAAVKGAQNLFNWAFPIVGDVGADVQGKADKSALQQLGDAGLSALWFVPGLGELGEGAVRGAELAPLLGEVGTKIAGKALGGAALGYGADVSSNLAQGKTGLGALTPGLGTVTGGVLGGVSPLASKAVQKALPILSERPAAAFQTLSEKPQEVQAAIKAGETPQTVLRGAQKAVRQLRTQLTQDWETNVNNMADQFKGVRVGVPDTMDVKFQNLVKEFPSLEDYLPQNPKNMSAKELTQLLKGIHSISPLRVQNSAYGYLVPQVERALKQIGISSFGGENGAFDTLYKDYTTRKGVLDGAKSILAMGNKATPRTKQTAVNLMTTLFNSNKQEYLKALQALENATGQDITGKAAGLQFQQTLPNLKGILSPNVAKGGFELLKAILAAPLSSPRGAAAIQKGLASQPGLLGQILQRGASVIPTRAATAIGGLPPSTTQ